MRSLKNKIHDIAQESYNAGKNDAALSLGTLAEVEKDIVNLFIELINSSFLTTDQKKLLAEEFRNL